MHRIVVIEDNPADVLLLRLALDEHGEEYQLELLKDGADGLRFVDEHRNAGRVPDPCVFVLDLHLPKYDGITVLETIKGSPKLRHIHVVVLTSSVSPKEEAEVKRLGVRLYRAKPSRLDDFMQLGADIMAICKEQQTLTAGV